MESFEGKWCVSCNGEEYEAEFFDTKDEAVEHGLTDDSYEDVEEIYVGRASIFKPKIYAEDVLENINAEAYDYNEYGADYLTDIPEEHTIELQNELQKVLDSWLAKHSYEPNFFNVVDECRIDRNSGLPL